MYFYKFLAYKLKIRSWSNPTTLFNRQRHHSENGTLFSQLLLNHNSTLYPTANLQMLSKCHPSQKLEASPISYSKDPHIHTNVIKQQNLKCLFLFYECTKGNLSSNYTSEEMQWQQRIFSPHLTAAVWQFSHVLFYRNINFYGYINVSLGYNLKILGNNHKGYERLFIFSDNMAEQMFCVLCKPESYPSKGCFSI